MKPRKSSVEFCGLGIALFCLLFSMQVASAQILLPDPSAGSSKPFDGQINVPIEKGKKVGLFFRFKCVDGMGQPTTGCFPLAPPPPPPPTPLPLPTVQLTIGATVSSSVLTCPAPTLTTVLTCAQLIQGGVIVPPPSGQCSYKVVDGVVAGDTVEIIYNGDFPKTQPIDYSVTGAHNIPGTVNQFSANPHDFRFCSGTDNPKTASIELVFDISGSMGLPTVQPATSLTPTRLAALQLAAQTALALDGIIDSYAIPGDKLAAVFFSTKATPDPTPPTLCGTPNTNLLAADDPNNVSSVASSVQIQTPTSSTSIGAGLQAANTCGFTRDLPGNSNKTVLLFSDGEQNTSPMVTVNNGQVFLDGSPYDPSISICPVTAGRMTAAGFMLQDSIAVAKCNGHEVHIADTDQNFALAGMTGLQSFFMQSLAAIMPTDKLELVVDNTGVVTRPSSAVEKFLVASDDVKMTLVLSWFDGSEGDRILPFRLTAPDGTVIDLANRTRVARNTSFTTLPLPVVQGGVQIAHKGEWQLEIIGSDLHSPALNYHFMVLSDNAAIASDFSISAQDVGTGEPIPIQVKLTDNGSPILNATVQAQLVGPNNSQGNILSNTPNPPPPQTPGGDPALTKGQAKLDALYNDPKNASLFADKNLPTLTLIDSGNTGVYTGQFKDTSNEGHYYFSVRVRGTSARGGDFQRAYRIVRFVRSKPDPANSVFKLLSYVPQTNGSVLVTLQAIPHDALGNFLGPGYERDMQIKSSDGSLPESPLDDKLDGSYEITYRLPSAAANPSYTIQIMGTTVKAETLQELRSQSNNHPKLALFLDAGANIPEGTFGNGFNKGFSLNAGLEYIAHPHFSLEGIFGYHHFPAKIGTSLNVYQFSVNGKTYLMSGTIRPFVNGGIGGYAFSPGSTCFGGNVGGGILYNLTPRFGLQGSYNFHMANTTGTATKWSTVQGGLRVVF